MKNLSVLDLVLSGVKGLNTIAHCMVLNPLSPDSDLSQISHCSIKGLLVREVMRIESMITQVTFSRYFNSFSPLLL